MGCGSGRWSDVGWAAGAGRSLVASPTKPRDRLMVGLAALDPPYKPFDQKSGPCASGVAATGGRESESVIE